MDIVAHRRECDRLLALGISVNISSEHLESFGRPARELVVWLIDRGYSTGGVTPNPNSVWLGCQQNGRESNGTVIFHPDRSQDALLFKLTWG